MSQIISYKCPNCSRYARIPGSELCCKICNKIICFGCSKHEICHLCRTKMTPDQSNRINRAARNSKLGSIYICLGFVVGILGSILVAYITNTSSILLGFSPLIVFAIVGFVLAARLRSKFLTVCDRVVNEMKNT